MGVFHDRNRKMDYSYDNYTTEPAPIHLITKCDRDVLVNTMFGLIIGLLCNVTCVCFRTSRKKMEDLMDDNEDLRSVIEDLKLENNDLTNQNDRLTVDASASERLIERLKTEINMLSSRMRDMEYEIAGLDSDNKAYLNELSAIRDAVRHRNRETTPPPLIRKRYRDDLDL